MAKIGDDMYYKLSIAIFLIMLLVAGCQSAGLMPPPSQPQSHAPPSSPPPTQTALPQEENAPGGLLLEVTEPQDAIIVKTNTIKVSGTTSPDAEVSINDQFVVIDTSGRFTTTVSLEQGPNALEVTASDSNGNETFRILTIIYMP
jgi:hypothetical protein